MTAEEMTNDATKQHRKLNHQYKHLKKYSSAPFFGQLAASAKHGCVMETATARTTRTRTTVTPWCASCLTTHARPTTPSVSPLRSCATAPTTVRTAQTRSYVVKCSPCTKTHLTQELRRRPVSNASVSRVRPVCTGQRRLQPQLHHHPRGGLHVLLSAGYGAGSRQQDLPDPELLRQAPQV